MKIRSLFISDLHLGSNHSKTIELLDFINKFKKHPPENIYLIGDIIDIWKLRRSWHWDDHATLVIKSILGFLKHGTTITYLSGNHDAFIKDFIEDYRVTVFGHLRICNEAIHTTLNGDKFLVIHGDMFDLVTKYAKWLCKLGDVGYEILLKLNVSVNKIRRYFGYRQWSLSQSVKYNVKSAVNYMSDFEKCLVDYGISKGCIGCICGHIHHANLKKLADGFVYANSGDWVESCTAIVETYDGKLDLINYYSILNMVGE